MVRGLWMPVLPGGGSVSGSIMQRDLDGEVSDDA